MSVLKGRKFMIFHGTTPKAVAYATSHSLNLNAETSDASTKDHGIWSSAEITRVSWDASIDALVSADNRGDNFSTLFDLMVAGAAIDVVLGIPSNYTDSGVPTTGWTAPTTGSTTTYYKGKAIITSLNRNDAVGSDSSLSCSLQGVGSLTKTDGSSTGSGSGIGS